VSDYIGAPRPRVLAIGLTDAEVDLIRPLAGSLTVVESVHSIHPEEHDVMVHSGSGFSAGAGIIERRVVFAPPAEKDQPRFATSSGSGSGGSYRPPTSSTTQFKPAHALEITQFARDSGLEPLVRRSCWPADGGNYTGFRTPVHPARVAHVLLREQLEYPYAMAAILESVDEEDRADSAFWLPDIARTAISDWVRVAFDRWRVTSPKTFPQTAEWRHSNAWAAPAEVMARRQLADFEAAEAQRLAEAEEIRQELARGLEATESDGESWRVLISASGDELVHAVNESLQLFGFHVIDSDSLPQHKGRKREDLRVSDGGWTTLVEVKGYGGAAKSNDLQQLTAASTAFAAAEQKIPDALWYVVNIHRFIDPEQREIALPAREQDLAAFAENHSGALIDTRELFTLRQLVAAQEISPTEARSRLKSSASRFSALSRIGSEITGR
jgi:hypothetical protein